MSNVGTFCSLFLQYFEYFQTITKHIEAKNLFFVNVTTCFKTLF